MCFFLLLALLILGNVELYAESISKTGRRYGDSMCNHGQVRFSDRQRFQLLVKEYTKLFIFLMRLSDKDGNLAQCAADSFINASLWIFHVNSLTLLKQHPNKTL